MKVVLIQCTKTKRDETAEARKLYDPSDYFRKMRAYAVAKTGEADEWYILSGKHGLVHPETVLEPYNEVGLSERQAREIAGELSDMGVDTAELVAGGRDYCDPLTPHLERHGIDVLEPFRGLLIGERKQRLKSAVRELQNEQLC